MRVLIIEDNRDLASNMFDFLETKGHVVDAAGDGITGMHLALVNQYDAIVLDLTLPGLDGITLCRKLREEGGKDTPVLMITAAANAAETPGTTSNSTPEPNCARSSCVCACCFAAAESTRKNKRRWW